MTAGRTKRVFIANIIFYATLIGTLALFLLILYGIILLIRGLPKIATNLILVITIIIGFGSFFMINYIVWKYAKKKWKVKDSDVIDLDA